MIARLLFISEIALISMGPVLVWLPIQVALCRLWNIDILTIGLGIGPKMKQWWIGNLRAQVNWIPMGGYVRLRSETWGPVPSGETQEDWERLQAVMRGKSFSEVGFGQKIALCLTSLTVWAILGISIAGLGSIATSVWRVASHLPHFAISPWGEGSRLLGVCFRHQQQGDILFVFAATAAAWIILGSYTSANEVMAATAPKKMAKVQGVTLLILLLVLLEAVVAFFSFILFG